MEKDFKLRDAGLQTKIARTSGSTPQCSCSEKCAKGCLYFCEGEMDIACSFTVPMGGAAAVGWGV